MGESFRIEDAIPFARDVLSGVWDRKPLYIRGQTDIFFYGCPCGKEGNIVKMLFRLNLNEHRRHVIEKVKSVYNVNLEPDALLNGSGSIGGLASHVQELLEAPGSRRNREKEEAEAARLRRLQIAALRDARLGGLRKLP